ncbi:MAG: winged helix-turn-helix transcriptional regulator [Gemmatimonadota bacterium]|nr:MAG: winged helix-turn-helix transcriptional regulator [Gemmatimonadota bacterium]
MLSSAQPDLGRCCQQFQALSDQTRVGILELLRDGEKCVCELTAALQVRQPLLSFHLKTLKSAGLVKDRKDGRWVHYSIDWRGVKELQRLIEVLQPEASPQGLGERDDPASCGRHDSRRR